MLTPFDTSHASIDWALSAASCVPDMYECIKYVRCIFIIKHHDMLYPVNYDQIQMVMQTSAIKLYVFYNNVFRFMLLLEINFILSYNHVR